MTTADSTIRIIYEGPGSGAELMGSTQANFIVMVPGADREVSVLLNDPAAAFLAEQLGTEQTAAWREAVTREAGRAAIQARVAGGQHLDAVIMISRTTLDQHPGILEAVRAALGA